MENRRRLIFIYAATLAAILLFALLPVIVAMGSILVANSAGCALDEGSTHPCMVMGSDMGETLQFFFVCGWFAILTLPAGLAAVTVWAVALIVHLAVRSARARQS